jgi:uncharacterized protein
MGRIDCYLVVGGKFHDIDYARLRLLELLGEDEQIRTKVGQDYHDIDAICASDFLVTYTSDVRPTLEQQQRIRSWVEGGGRWFALHSTNAALDPPSPYPGTFSTPRVFPLFVDTLGSQFISHPAMDPYDVTVSVGAHDDPLIAGIGPFTVTQEELYLSEFYCDVTVLLETRWAGTTRGFTEGSWEVDEPRPVMYRRPLGAGEVVYLTLGHRRSTWDMVDPPFDGEPFNKAPWPRIEYGSWPLPQFMELLRRGIRWGAGLPITGGAAATPVTEAETAS